MPVVSDALADALAREAPEVDAATLARVADFATRWHLRPGSEEQLSQQFLVELCAALGVEAPGLAPAEDYCFEKRVSAGDIRGKIDLYKKDHFILEAKCGREKGEAAPRGTRACYAYLVRAYGEQARQYAFMLPEGPPPLLIVVDVGSERTSREAARRLATLARDLEAQHGAAAAGRIARFLMRCLFCMFAEDVELLPRRFFTDFLERASERPERIEIEVGRLFAEMDTGGSFNFSDIRRFNGALFREPGGAVAMGLPLTAGQIAGLLEHSGTQWGGKSSDLAARYV